MNYFEINLKGMENRFSNVIFCMLRFVIVKEIFFMSKFWPQHHGAEIGVSADIFGNYDVPYEKRVV